MLLWRAPAKLNLFLRITGRRADGYHELQTVFQLIGLFDELGFEPLPDGRVELADPMPGVPPEADLVVRAARLAQQEAGTGPGHPPGVRIRRRKRIPAGAGLGGGSADAAVTLLALDRLWGLGLEPPALAALGLELGADVPVFVRGRSALGAGVGERLVPLALPEAWFLVISPRCHVPTGAVFADPALTRDSLPVTIPDSLFCDPPSSRGGPSSGRPRDGAGGASGWRLTRELARLGGNDCEAVVRARFPAVGAVLDWLGERASARMTGTGACVFAVFPTEGEARRVAAETPKEWDALVAPALNELPPPTVGAGWDETDSWGVAKR